MALRNFDENAALEAGPSYGGLFSTRVYEAESGGTIRLDDAALLFKGHFERVGSDLVLSDAFHRVVVHDYFSVETRPRLEAPNGASLTDAVVAALSHHPDGEQVAQAGGAGGNPAIGRVQTLTGSATVTRNGVTVALHVGDLVYKNDAIQTARDSALAVSFLDGTLFSLSADARMVLNEMVYAEGAANNAALFSLVQGTITFVAGKVAKTGDMKVGTPVATMGIRGTAVHVQIEADGGDTRFSVMTEPDGTVGRFDVYDRNDPTKLLFTVSDPNLATIVHPNGPRDVTIETVAKTPLDLDTEAGIVRSLFKTLFEAPRLPIFQGPATGGGSGSGVPPNVLEGPGGIPGGGGPNLPPPDTLQPNPNPVTPTPGGDGAPRDPGTSPGLPPPEPTDGVPPLAVRPQTVPVVQGASVLTTDRAAGLFGGTAEGDFRVVGAHAGAEPGTPDAAVADGRVMLRGQYGALVLYADGTYYYRADQAASLAEGHHGTDVFSVAVTGPNGVSVRTTFSVDVAGLNDAPTVAHPVALEASAGGEARALTAAALLAGAADIDGDVLAVADLAVASGGGRIVDLGGGQYRYEPAEDADGPVVLSYRVVDTHGAGVAQTAHFTLTPVNHAPTVAGALTLADSPEGRPRSIAAADLLKGAADRDGDTLSVTELAVASGSGRIVDLGGGQYRYEPGEDAGGPVVLSYRIADGRGGSVAQTAQFELVPAEAKPVLGLPGGAASYREDAPPLAIAEGLSVRDADSAALSGATVTITEGFAAGQDVLGVTIPAGSAIRAHYDARTGTLTLTGEASPTAYQAVLASLTYRNTSDAPATAPRTVSIVVEDDTGLMSAPVTRGIGVVAVEDAPVAGDDNAFVTAGGAVKIDVLANDRDPDGGALTLESVGRPAHGSATLNADGTVTYRPAAGYSGPDSFTYTVKDASGLTATATVDVIVGIAGHQTVGGDVFLQGAYMEIGVSKHGSLGSASDAPEGFHPQGSQQLSFVIDNDGWGTGKETTSNDVTIPGTPEDAIVIAHDGKSFANSERTGQIDFDATTTDTSSGGRLQATTVGTSGDGLKVTQVIDLDPNATYFRTTVTLTNTTSETMKDARFMRSFDPDQDAIRYGDYATDNDVLANPTARGGVAVVQAYGTHSGVSVNLVAFDKAARASSDGFYNHDAYLESVYDKPRDPNGDHIDTGISLNIKFGDLRPGQSVTHTFYTSLNGNQGANDLIVGSEAAQALDGRGGDDIILGLGGGDILTGGTGRDTFVFDAVNFKRTTITDFTAGADTLQFDHTVFASAEAALAKATQSGQDVLIGHDRDNVVVLKNVLLASLHADDIHIV